MLQAQAYLGVFYMRGLQPQEKRGLKYLLQAANSGVGNPSFCQGLSSAWDLQVEDFRVSWKQE